MEKIGFIGGSMFFGSGFLNYSEKEAQKSKMFFKSGEDLISYFLKVE